MKKSTALKSDTTVFEEHIAQLHSHSLCNRYLDTLRAFCGKLPDAQLELVVSDPTEESGWSRRLNVESEVIDYQVRLWLGGKPTNFVIPFSWLEQIAIRMEATFHVINGVIRHLTYLEKLEEILQWVTLWEFCDHCSRAGVGGAIDHSQYLVEYKDRPVKVRQVRVIRNSLQKEYWWLIMGSRQETLSTQLHMPVFPEKGRPVVYDKEIANAMRRSLHGFHITRVE